MTESFGELLKRLRLRLGVSQNQLARLAGIDPAYVNRLEKGGCPPPSRRVVLRLWDALETSTGDRERLLVAAGLCPEPLLHMTVERLEALILLVRADE